MRTDKPSSDAKNSIVFGVGYGSMEKASFRASFCSSEKRMRGFLGEPLLLSPPEENEPGPFPLPPEPERGE